MKTTIKQVIAKLKKEGYEKVTTYLGGSVRYEAEYEDTICGVDIYNSGEIVTDHCGTSLGCFLVEDYYFKDAEAFLKGEPTEYY